MGSCPSLQLEDLAPFIGLLLWTCRHFIYYGQNTRDKSKRNRLLGIEVRNALACVAGVERGRGQGGRGKGGFPPPPLPFLPLTRRLETRVIRSPWAPGVIKLRFAHSIYSQWKSKRLPFSSPEPVFLGHVVRYKLRRVALGTRMAGNIHATHA